VTCARSELAPEARLPPGARAAPALPHALGPTSRARLRLCARVPADSQKCPRWASMRRTTLRLPTPTSPVCATAGRAQVPDSTHSCACARHPSQSFDSSIRFVEKPCTLHHLSPPPPSQQLTASGRAGRIGINTAGQFHFAIDTLPWGAHPSETLVALESGQGWTKNTLGVVGVDKVRVLPAP
jgi:hypothetical protein